MLLDPGMGDGGGNPGGYDGRASFTTMPKIEQFGDPNEQAGIAQKVPAELTFANPLPAVEVNVASALKSVVATPGTVDQTTVVDALKTVAGQGVDAETIDPTLPVVGAIAGHIDQTARIESAAALAAQAGAKVDVDASAQPGAAAVVENAQAAPSAFPDHVRTQTRTQYEQSLRDHNKLNPTQAKSDTEITAALAKYDTDRAAYEASGEYDNDLTVRQDQLIADMKAGKPVDTNELNAINVRLSDKNEMARLNGKLQSKEGLTPDEKQQLDTLTEKYKPNTREGEQPTAQEIKSLNEQSEDMLKKIENGEGDLLENVLDYEALQHRMQGENLTANMRKVLAMALREQARDPRNDNPEAETVLQKIAELYGLESQMANCDEQYKQLNDQAKDIDQKLTAAQKSIRFNKTPESAKKRKEVYGLFVQLTMKEAQMAQLADIDRMLETKYNSTSNQIDFTLGRQHIGLYILRGVDNGIGKLSRIRKPTLRSTMHKNFFGFNTN